MRHILILINFLWLTKIIASIVNSKKKEVKEVWELLRLSNCGFAPWGPIQAHILDKYVLLHIKLTIRTHWNKILSGFFKITNMVVEFQILCKYKILGHIISANFFLFFQEVNSEQDKIF